MWMCSHFVAWVALLPEQKLRKWVRPVQQRIRRRTRSRSRDAWEPNEEKGAGVVGAPATAAMGAGVVGKPYSPGKPRKAGLEPLAPLLKPFVTRIRTGRRRHLLISRLLLRAAQLNVSRGANLTLLMLGPLIVNLHDLPKAHTYGKTIILMYRANFISPRKIRGFFAGLGYVVVA